EFPQEIVEEVVGHAHNDLQTLISCSLLDKKWCSASRHHIFCSITLSDETVNTLKQLLSSLDCTFTSVTRSVVI
ncbi:hypothetical protein C8J56DRAFT_754565, partial [Mycena floridula]